MGRRINVAGAIPADDADRGRLCLSACSLLGGSGLTPSVRLFGREQLTPTDRRFQIDAAAQSPVKELFEFTRLGVKKWISRKSLLSHILAVIAQKGHREIEARKRPR